MDKSRSKAPRPLVIHCTSHDPRCFTWYYREVDGRLHSGDQHTPLPAAVSGTVLLLPASQIIFHQATLRHITPQTLSWQLENQALSEPEMLHTVVLQQEGEQVHLAAVDRQWLHQLLAHLRSRGIAVTRALPDALVPDENQALRLGDRWLIRHQRWQGISLNEQQLAPLQLHAPLLATLVADSGQQAADGPASAGQLYQLACRQRINLLQGEFAVRLPLRHARTFALACALCSVLLLLIPPLWSGWQAGTQLKQAGRQSLALYQRYFPDEKPARPAARMTERLNALSAVPAADGPLRLLADSAAMLATLQDNPLQTLRWDEKQQQLHLSFASTLPAALSDDGLTIQIQENIMTIGRKP